MHASQSMLLCACAHLSVLATLDQATSVCPNRLRTQSIMPFLIIWAWNEIVTKRKGPNPYKPPNLLNSTSSLVLKSRSFELTPQTIIEYYRAHNLPPRLTSFSTTQERKHNDFSYSGLQPFNLRSIIHMSKFFPIYQLSSTRLHPWWISGVFMPRLQATYMESRMKF